MTTEIILTNSLIAILYVILSIIFALAFVSAIVFIIFHFVDIWKSARRLKKEIKK